MCIMQAVIEIVKANSGNNQSQIVALAQQAGIAKHQVEDCLKDCRFERQRVTGKELLYTLAERTPELRIQPSLLR
jgi:hypothetical protein